MRTNLRIQLAISLVLVVVAVTADAKTIYVDADRPPGGGGTNWADAYKYLQDALADADASAKPVEIRVAQGTYKPDEGAGVEDANRTETFQLINDVTLKGGYAGFGELDPNARDITGYESILSGDLDGNDVPVPTSDLLTEPTRAENSYHVVTGSGADANAVLDGFTITAGNADGSNPEDCGGGMYSDYGSPTISSCICSENSANVGGGICTWDEFGSGSKIINCMFSSNYAGYGGGMYGSETTLVKCTFSGNIAGVGGGVYCNEMTLTNCRFTNNSASSSGGGMKNYLGDPTLTNCSFTGNSAGGSGGGINLSGSSSTNPALTNCTFIDNSASDNGGGMYLYGGDEPTLTNCTFIGNSSTNDGGGIFDIDLAGSTPRVTNSTFTGNLAGGDGGGFASSHCYTVFTNCTFSNNSAGDDGGGFCCFGNPGTPAFNNCILWGNTASGEGPEIAVKVGTLTVDYSNVQGGKSDIYEQYPDTLVYHDANNIEVDPLFVDADGADDTVGTEDDNLQLLADSNCIDAGDNTAVPADTTDLDGDANTTEPVPYDLDGNPRFIDDLCTTDTGNGTAPVVDMGTYEFLRSDIDSDGNVNFRDFAQFALYWLDVACGACGGADLTCDGDVNAPDLKELTDNWLW